MARVTYSTTRYSFNKPQIITEKEFLVYKEIFNEDPNYNISPKSGFWQEFELLKWLLIIITIGGLLALIWDELAFIPGIAIFLLIMFLVTGGGETMLNYSSYMGAKDEYYSKLRKTVIMSKNYDDFLSKAAVL
jgi:hypothetical protein